MKDMWEAYVSTNQRFTETVREVYEDGDMIWVHGYHLMLVPLMIRAYLPNATIGFNMHIPFPTSEIFRVLPWRREILMGLLGADFIGFQVPGHSRHFVHCCTRVLLGTSSIGAAQISYRGRVTRLLVCECCFYCIHCFEWRLYCFEWRLYCLLEWRFYCLLFVSVVFTVYCFE